MFLLSDRVSVLSSTPGIAFIPYVIQNRGPINPRERETICTWLPHQPLIVKEAAGGGGSSSLLTFPPVFSEFLLLIPTHKFLHWSFTPCYAVLGTIHTAFTCKPVIFFQMPCFFAFVIVFFNLDSKMGFSFTRFLIISVSVIPLNRVFLFSLQFCRRRPPFVVYAWSESALSVIKWLTRLKRCWLTIALYCFLTPNPPELNHCARWSHH